MTLDDGSVRSIIVKITNGLLRQYMPEGSDLAIYSQEDFMPSRCCSTRVHGRRSAGGLRGPSIQNNWIGHMPMPEIIQGLLSSQI